LSSHCTTLRVRPANDATVSPAHLLRPVAPRDEDQLTQAAGRIGVARRVRPAAILMGGGTSAASARQRDGPRAARSAVAGCSAAHDRRSGVVQWRAVIIAAVSLHVRAPWATLVIGVAVILAPVAVVAGCGGSAAIRPARTVTAAPRAAMTAATRAPRRATATVLRLADSATLPAPVQLPGLARSADGRVLAVGGLDANDSSVADVVEVLPGPAHHVGQLPQPAHDIGVTALAGTVYAFGGGTAAGPVSTIVAVHADGRALIAGRLPVAMSDTTAVTLASTAYVIGGYTTTTPLRSVLAFRPGHRVRDVARLPYPVRYTAAAVIGSRIYVAGGTTGTRARREIVEVDPAAHSARVVGRLPGPLAHAAGVALHGIFYVLGGRGDALTGQDATIWAFDPATRRLRRAGRLPLALSDLAAVSDGERVVVVGGRDRQGAVHAERWRLRRA